jgi:hypothetical protein
MKENIFVRVPHSHRKLSVLVRRLGYKPQFYYSFQFAGNFIRVTPEQYAALKPLVTRARDDTDRLLRCWDGGTDPREGEATI